MQFQGLHKPNFIIKGINHYDYDEFRSNITFVDGGIDSERIWIKIESQPSRAIRSIFEFCGERHLPDDISL